MGVLFTFTLGPVGLTASYFGVSKSRVFILTGLFLVRGDALVYSLGVFAKWTQRLMIKLILTGWLGSRWRIPLSMAGLCAAIAACDSSSAPPSREATMEPLAVAASLQEGFSSLGMTQGPLKESLAYHFDSSSDLTRFSDWWLTRGVPLTYSSNQGNQNLGSVFVKGRRAPWQGPLIRLPNLEGDKVYRASAWFKFVGTSAPVSVSLVLTRVEKGSSTSLTLNQTLLETNRWQRLEGEFTAAPKASDGISALHFEVSNIDANYYVDDLVVAATELAADAGAVAETIAPAVAGVAPPDAEEKYVRNGDAEGGLDHWTHQGGDISLSSAQAHSGQFSVLITGRTKSWNAPVVPVYGLEDSV